MTRSLPKSADDLKGLRAARWTRESTPGQTDKSGPEAQRYEQDDGIERTSLVDTGIAWLGSHSGFDRKAIAASEQWADMLDRAGRDYDVLVVAYVSRFCRNVDIGTSIREQLHAQGGTIYFAEEGIVLSNEDDWQRWIGLLVESEMYTRNLKRTMERTYRNKFRTHKDPGGMAPLGFRRSGGTPSVLEVDPDTIAQAVNLFQRFAIGVSARQLAAETGLHEERIKPILRNRIYNGWVRRYDKWVAAAWRDNPPVSDELWDAVEKMREAKSRGGGPRRTDRVDLLNGLLYCTCGQKLWSEPSGEKYRKRHRSPCDGWGATERLMASTWERPIMAQVAQIDLSPATMAQIAAAFAAPARLPNEVRLRALEKERTELARQYGKKALTLAEFALQSETLDRQEDAVLEAPVASQITPEQAMEYLRALPLTFAAMGPREQGDILRAVYKKIDVRGPEFVGVELTPDALAHGLALALPEQVQIAAGVRVGGEGLEPPTPSV